MKKIGDSENLILKVIAIISLMAFIFILINFNGAFLFNLDGKINIAFSGIQNNFLIGISEVLSGVFEPIVFFILFLFAIGFLINKRRKKEAISLVILTALSFSLLQMLKVIIHRARPANALLSESSFSFPSGHALMAIVFFGILVYLFEHHISSRSRKRIITILATLIVVAISASRIVLGAHWFSDVLASAMLGTFLLSIYILILRKTKVFGKTS